MKISQECKFNCSHSKDRQAWLDQECRNKKQIVYKALKEYSLLKSEETRKKESKNICVGKRNRNISLTEAEK